MVRRQARLITPPSNWGAWLLQKESTRTSTPGQLAPPGARCRLLGYNGTSNYIVLTEDNKVVTAHDCVFTEKTSCIKPLGAADGRLPLALTRISI